MGKSKNHSKKIGLDETCRNDLYFYLWLRLGMLSSNFDGEIILLPLTIKTEIVYCVEYRISLNSLLDFLIHYTLYSEVTVRVGVDLVSVLKGFLL